MDKAQLAISILMFLGLIAYPAFLVLGWGYLVSLGLSVAGFVFGTLYVIGAIAFGFCWILLSVFVIAVLLD